MAISMMGRGAAIDPQTLQERQRMADLMMQKSLVPAENEQSAAQGLARMLQGAISGYDSGQVQKDRETYKQQRISDMQRLGSALGGGTDAYKSIIPQLTDPDTQMLAFGMAKGELDNANKLKNEREMASAKFENEKALERSKFGNQVELEGIKQEGTHNLEWLKSGNKMAEKRDESISDPVKAIQSKIAGYTQVLSDPNAHPQQKAQAQERLKIQTEALTAMKPPSSSVTVNTGKAETAGQVKRAEKIAEKAVMQEDQYAEGAINAGDQLFKMNQIKKNILGGKLTTSKLTPAGKAIQQYASVLGIGNDSAAAAQYLQTANDQLVTERKRLQGQGQISDRETRMLEATVLRPDDTLEAIESKIAVFEQLAERQQRMAQLSNEWVKRYGGIDQPAQNGKTFREVQAKLIDQNPLMSLEDMAASKAAAATQAMQQAQGGGAPDGY